MLKDAMKENKYEKILDQLREELVILQETRLITEQDLKIPEWYELHQEYQTAKSDVVKITISVKNAILFQKRLYFCLTRKSIRKLIENDQNWDTKPKFTDSNYKAILKFLCDDFKIMSLFQENDYMRPSIYKTEDMSLINTLVINPEKQLKQTQDFVSKYNPKTSPHQGPHLVVSSKKVVVSNGLTIQSEKQLIEILSKNNTLDIIKELKRYNVTNPKNWIRVIRSNCDEVKANDIISFLDLKE